MRRVGATEEGGVEKDLGVSGCVDTDVECCCEACCEEKVESGVDDRAGREASVCGGIYELERVRECVGAGGNPGSEVAVGVTESSPQPRYSPFPASSSSPGSSMSNSPER